MNEGLESMVRSGFRPANLPPKEQREVERHQAHVEAVLAAAGPMSASSIAREAERRALDALWRTELVTAPTLVLTDQMKRLWAEYGLPSAFVRAVVWPLAASDGKAQDESADSPEQSGREVQRLIRLDVQRTLPFLGITNEPSKTAKCESVLEKFCGHSDYVQGMSYVAVRLMVELGFDESKTLVCLDRLVRRSPTIACLYRLDLAEIENSVEFVLDAVAWANVPDLWLFLKKLQFQSIQWFFLEWALTIFVKSFSMKISAFVIDMTLLSGDTAVYAAAVAVLVLLKEQLLVERDPEAVRAILARAGDVVDSEAFVKTFHEVVIPPAVSRILASGCLFIHS